MCAPRHARGWESDGSEEMPAQTQKEMKIPAAAKAKGGALKEEKGAAGSSTVQLAKKMHRINIQGLGEPEEATGSTSPLRY